MDMDFNRIFSAFSAVAGKQTLSESEKKDKPWTDSSGKEHPGTAVKGDKYKGDEAEKDDKKKGVKESTLAELIAKMDAIIAEGKDEDKADKADKADKDYDGDGKVESGKDEVIGSRRKAAGLDEAEKSDKPWTDMKGNKHPGTAVKGDKYKGDEAEKEAKKKVDESNLAECGMMGGMEAEQDSGMSVNTSIDTRTGRKTVSISADGEKADELMQMLKLAGMKGMSGGMGDVDGDGDHDIADHAREMGGEVVSIPLAHAEGGYKGVREVDEEYANEPNPQTQSVDTQLRQGNDMHREKTMHKHSYRQGDNPMAMREAAELAMLEAEIMEELDGIKVKKPTAKYGNTFKKPVVVKKVR